MYHSSIPLEPQQCVFLLASGADENLGAVEGIAEPPQKLSLPLTSAKEHCTSGVLHCSRGVIEGKETRKTTTNMSKRHREEMRDQINPKANIPKGQKAKQQLKGSQRLVGAGHQGAVTQQHSCRF